MDVERLATAVFREKVVWSCKDPLHYDRNIVASAWTRIGLEIGTQDQQLSITFVYIHYG